VDEEASFLLPLVVSISMLLIADIDVHGGRTFSSCSMTSFAAISRPDQEADHFTAGSLTTATCPPRLSLHGTTRVADAILVNAPTFEGGYLLQGQAVAISRTTRIYALPFGRLSGRKGKEPRLTSPASSHCPRSMKEKPQALR
jgi:hypothetical protein